MADDAVDSDVDERFLAATDFIKSHASRLDAKTLLHLYARYKQAKEGPCNTDRPGLFDFQGKQKWDSWHRLGDMSQSVAMMEYIAAVAAIDADWETKVRKEVGGEDKPRQAGMGVAVSTMVNEDTVIDDELKTVFDWCKEGNVRSVARLLDGSCDRINAKDEEGMTLLHWACDRGYTDLVKLLLDKKASINSQDAEKQTPLHFAVCCGHHDIVGLLLSRGADPHVQDCDGLVPSELDTTCQIKQLFAAPPNR